MRQGIPRAGARKEMMLSACRRDQSAGAGRGFEFGVIGDHHMTRFLSNKAGALEAAEVLVDALAGDPDAPGEVLLGYLLTDPPARRSDWLSVLRRHPEQAFREPGRNRKTGQIIRPHGE